MLGAVSAFASFFAAAVPSPTPSPSPPPNEAVVETAAGSFVIRLLPDVAPAHVKHFIKTARAGGYDGTTFHRVVPRFPVGSELRLSLDPLKLHGGEPLALAHESIYWPGRLEHPPSCGTGRVGHRLAFCSTSVP